MRLRAASPALVGLAVLAAGGAPARPLGRALAAPEILMVYGAPLQASRVIADQAEAHVLLLSAPTPGPSSPLGAGMPSPVPGRPALRLALFWGAGWREAARSPDRLRALRPEQAEQHGYFFPAIDTAPARLEVGAIAGVLVEPGLAVLRRHGVPVRLPAR